jgi:hypothetical protein
VSQRWPGAYVAAPPVSEGGADPHFVYRYSSARRGRPVVAVRAEPPHLFEAFMRALDLEWMLTDPKWKGRSSKRGAAGRAAQTMLASVRDRTSPTGRTCSTAIATSSGSARAEVLEHPQLLDRRVRSTSRNRSVRQPGPQFG